MKATYLSSLAEDLNPPRRRDFTTVDEYARRWQLWRALRRDQHSTPDEHAILRAGHSARRKVDAR